MKKFITFILFLTLIATIYLLKTGSNLSAIRLYNNLKSEIVYILDTESMPSSVSMILARYDGQIAKANHGQDMNKLGKWTEYLGAKFEQGYRLIEIYVDINELTDSEATEISLWFENQPKTYLIVDGFNSPEVVSQKFKFYQDRVYLKIYTWDELLSARKLNFLAAMLDGDVVVKHSDGVSKLKKYEGFYVNFRVKRLSHSLDILELLRIKGVEVYLDDETSNISDTQTKSHLCKVADYFYGFYSTVKIDKDFNCP